MLGSEFDAVRTGYDLPRQLAVGGHGMVYASVRKSDNLPVAIKTVKIAKSLQLLNSEAKVPPEVVNMQKVQHIERCVSIYEYTYCHESYTIIMERPENMIDLRSYCMQRQSVPETEARWIFTEVFEALLDVHKAGLIHGDVKRENVLIDIRAKKIKLIDFGTSLPFSETSVCNVLCSTYLPPEYIRMKQFRALSYTAWTLGILLYEMLYSRLPFNMKEDMFSQNLTFPTIPNISPQLKDLLTKLLSPYPADRPSFQEIFHHPWLQTKDQNRKIHPGEQRFLAFYRQMQNLDRRRVLP